MELKRVWQALCEQGRVAGLHLHHPLAPPLPQWTRASSHAHHLRRRRRPCMKTPIRRIGRSPSAPWSRRILDPRSEVVLQWNRVFLISCILALFVDPLFLYLPTVGGPLCNQLDLNLGIIVTFLRSVTDLFYVAHMLLKFRTAFVAPSSKIFGRGELVMNPRKIALRYLKSDFCVDLAAMLPLPQFIIWCIVPAVKSSTTDHTNNTLSLIVLIQYIPRMFQLFPLTARIIKTTGVITKTAWAGAAYNLVLYMLASHILGAAWYLLSVGRQNNCWKIQCHIEDGSKGMPLCNLKFLECASIGMPERRTWLNATQVLHHCDASNPDITFSYGMFADAMTYGVLSAKFPEKYLYCLWWGLRNLSSYGQTLETTTYMGETAFAVLICIVGLVLFSHLIGNMQTYLQSVTVRLEEWRVKRRDTEEWMRHRQLPPELQERVRRFVQYKWLATRGVDEESILSSLPLDLRRAIKRHLCLNLVRRVPFFSQMDNLLLDAICERLVSSLSTQGTYILREGDPVNEMSFIIRGQLESSTTNGGRSGFFNSCILRPGDFCGEELLTWALLPNSTASLPSSTRTVKVVTEVEAFALRAEELRFVANQFKRLHSKKLQDAFRYYSHQWRAWGACTIQDKWRKYTKRKLAKELSLRECSFFYDSPDHPLIDHDFHTGNEESPNAVDKLKSTMLATRFAKNAMVGLHRKRGEETADDTDTPKLIKPDEPDFTKITDNDFRNLL